MTTRLGFVGVGKHARKLAAIFRECGAEIVAHDRRADDEAPGFGERLHWRDMLHPSGNDARPAVDAVIAVATPELTTEVALTCLMAGKRCLATKPLLITELPRGALMGGALRKGVAAVIDADLYVDLWRLYSPAWQALKADLIGKKIATIRTTFVGNGPVRTFSGALDYGPHALAFVGDLVGEFELGTARRNPSKNGQGDGVYTVEGTCGQVRVELEVGSGAINTCKSVTVEAERVTYEFTETQTQIYSRSGIVVECSRDYALRSFCRAFLSGDPSHTLKLSLMTQRSLEQVLNSSIEANPGSPP